MPDKKKIPALALERLCTLYGELGAMLDEGRTRAGSEELGGRTGHAAHTVRKDISLLGAATAPAGRAGYDTAKLRDILGRKLKITAKPRACIVGLGRLGAALLGFRDFLDCEIVAGFDISHNRIELLDTDVDLFPATRLAEKVKERQIALALLAVPAHAAQAAAEDLARAGIGGVLNFAPAALRVPEGVETVNIDFSNALRVLTARMAISSEIKQQNH